MIDINMIIANNILNILHEQGKKQTDLAEDICVSRQTMRKMLSGESAINAVELKKIAESLNVPMETITKVQPVPVETDVIRIFKGRIENENAKEALRIADEVSDMILFHSKVRKNGLAMMQPQKNA